MVLSVANAATKLGAPGIGIGAPAFRPEDEGGYGALTMGICNPGVTPHAMAKPTFYACLREVSAQIAPDAAINDRPHPEVRAGGMCIVPAREWVSVFDRQARALNCPDFGLRSARHESTLKDDNPFLLAQYNAETVSEVIQWAERSSRALGRVFLIRCVAPAYAKWAVIEYNLVAGDALRRRQAVEYGVAMILHRLLAIAGPPEACEVWFSHQPISPKHVYAEHLPAKIRFGRAYNAILVNREYLNRIIPNRRPGILEVARSYIELHFPDGGYVLRAEAERIAARLLCQGSCELDVLASELGLHPRTLQRRLKNEGTSFFQVKDEAQRALALTLLRDESLSMKQIAMRLGYSAGSGLTRSCLRWFSAAPRDLRAQLVSSAANSGPE